VELELELEQGLDGVYQKSIHSRGHGMMMKNQFLQVEYHGLSLLSREPTFLIYGVKGRK